MTREQWCERADVQGYHLDEQPGALYDCTLVNTGLDLNLIVVGCLLIILLGVAMWWATRRTGETP